MRSVIILRPSSELTRRADAAVVGVSGQDFAANGGLHPRVAFVVGAKVDFLLASGAGKSRQTIANRLPS